jgi:hypothetical protein
LEISPFGGSMFYMVFTISIPSEIKEQMKPFLIKIKALNCTNTHCYEQKVYNPYMEEH